MPKPYGNVSEMCHVTLGNGTVSQDFFDTSFVINYLPFALDYIIFVILDFFKH
jgi:hypothetical protein